MKIGIIGASSQVGSSLAFYLKHFTEITPVCFVRSSYSQVFFEMTGIEYKACDINDTVLLKEELSKLDAVVDCTYPSGQLYEIPHIIRQNIKSITAAMPAGKTFIYFSTIMAYGMPDEYKHVKNFGIARSTYAYIKRIAEKTVESETAKNKLRGFNFRLGQVHGFLQSVNTSYREKLYVNQFIKLDGAPGDKVNVIFIRSLAEAVIKAAKKEILPGKYSLVNNPQWNLEELYGYYKEYYHYNTPVVYSGKQHTSVKQSIKNKISNTVKQYRGVLESYYLTSRPALYKKIKGRFRSTNAAAATSGVENDPYTDFHLLGTNPGKLVIGIECDKNAMMIIEKKMELLYNSFLEQNTAGSNG